MNCSRIRAKRRASLHFESAAGKYGVAQGCALLMTGCFVAPPPALTQWPPRRPTILHDSVVPSTNQILAQLPVDSVLLVPVEIDDPNESFEYRLFIDYQAADETSLVAEGQSSRPTSAGSGPIVVLALSLDTNVAGARLSTPYCHRIEAMVGHGFSAFHALDTVGGDSVTWLYDGAGNAETCPMADAGPEVDGNGGYGEAASQ